MKHRHFLITVFVLTLAISAMVPLSVESDIHVYDNNDQYLGIFIEMWGSGIELFIPSLNASFDLVYKDDYSDMCEYEWELHFESTDCSGQAYSEYPLPVINNFSACPQRSGYYVADYSGKKTFQPGSYIGEDGECHLNDGEDIPYTIYPLKEYYPFVQVQLPFTTPTALPIRFEVDVLKETRTVVIPLQ